MNTLGTILGDLGSINQGQFFEAIHHAYEETLGHDFEDKRLIFYHLHKNDPYSMANFLKYFPQASLLMIIRNPVQSCEAWVLKLITDKNGNQYTVYTNIVSTMSLMLMDVNSPVYSKQGLVAVRLEDIKRVPEQTMGHLCDYFGIEDAPSLYESTMQGLKWWGDPSSTLYGRTQTEYDKTTDPTSAEVGTFFSSKDRMILETLFYPLSVRFGYVEENGDQFREDLSAVRPLLDTPLDFEEKLSEGFSADYPALPMTGAFKHLHAVLLSLWTLLDEHGTYPYMMRVLSGG